MTIDPRDIFEAVDKTVGLRERLGVLSEESERPVGVLFLAIGTDIDIFDVVVGLLGLNIQFIRGIGLSHLVTDLLLHCDTSVGLLGLPESLDTSVGLLGRIVVLPSMAMELLGRWIDSWLAGRQRESCETSRDMFGVMTDLN